MEKLHKSFTKELLIKMKVGWSARRQAGVMNLLKSYSDSFYIKRQPAVTVRVHELSLVREQSSGFIEFYVNIFSLLSMHNEFADWKD